MLQSEVGGSGYWLENNLYYKFKIELCIQLPWCIVFFFAFTCVKIACRSWDGCMCERYMLSQPLRLCVCYLSLCSPYTSFASLSPCLCQDRWHFQSLFARATAPFHSASCLCAPWARRKFPKSLLSSLALSAISPLRRLNASIWGVFSVL